MSSSFRRTAAHARRRLPGLIGMIACAPRGRQAQSACAFLPGSPCMLLTGKGLGLMKRCPRRSRPLSILPILKGTILPSNRARIQWIGLAKRNSWSDQRIDLRKGIPVMTFVRIAGRRPSVASPMIFFRAQRYSPFSVVTRSSSAMPIPWPLAKPTAAREGFPCSSKATLAAGPSFSIT